MSALRVGMRVRTVDNGNIIGEINRKGIGREGVIVDEKPRRGWDWVVRFDCDGELWDARSGCLEPILYDGNQLVTWDACLWQPEGQPA